MPRINLLKRNPIVPVTVRTMRTTARSGVDPYNSRDALQSQWEKYARMCGAVPITGPELGEVEIADVFALLDVPAPAAVL